MPLDWARGAQFTPSGYTPSMVRLKPKGEEIPRYYTVGDVARQLDLAPATVVRYLKEGRLKGVKLGPGDYAPWRITAADVKAFLRRGKRVR